MAVQAEHQRLDRLLSYVRQLPSVVASRQADALGDLGPVSLTWGAGTARDPAVSVLYEGRPWAGLLSGGERIVAGYWLRAALRRLAGLDRLPIWVDHAQDWSGELPDLGHTIELRTTTGPLVVPAAR